MRRCRVKTEAVSDARESSKPSDLLGERFQCRYFLRTRMSRSSSISWWVEVMNFYLNSLCGVEKFHSSNTI